LPEPSVAKKSPSESSDIVTQPRIVRREAVTEADAPELVLARAFEAPPEVAAKYLDVYKEMMAVRAKQRFETAFFELKRECPPIPRETANPQFMVERNGIRVHRMYASLDTIERVIREPIERCGLSYRWTNERVVGDLLSLDCVVSHRDGHSISATATFPIGSKAGASDQQKYASASSYCVRHSLMRALGLLTCEADSGADAIEPVSPDQLRQLDAEIARTGTDEARFRKWIGLGVQPLSCLPSSDFDRAIAALRAKPDAAKGTA